LTLPDRATSPSKLVLAGLEDTGTRNVVLTAAAVDIDGVLQRQRCARTTVLPDVVDTLSRAVP
jgi:hypothetical protein